MPGWYISSYGFAEYNSTEADTANTTDLDANTTHAGISSANVVAYEFSRCPVDTYNNGGNVATICTPCPNGTTTRFDPGPWYGYYNMYNQNGGWPGNTEDLCGRCYMHNGFVIRGFGLPRDAPAIVAVRDKGSTSSRSFALILCDYAKSYMLRVIMDQSLWGQQSRF
jgi:hypothetical protein